MNSNKTMSDVGIVVIGRNEGDRFVRCLNSLQDWMGGLVYVDSGSTDGSAEKAREAGSIVVELDTTTPFTAARARNEGVEALLEHGTFTYVQFVDGDCEMDPGWIDTARQFLENNLKVAAVGGRLRESNPDYSVYNRLCAIEWNTPTGETKTIGGIGFYRLTDFLSAGKFNPTLIAGEEPELCLRLRQSGHKIVRLEAEMANHDAHIATFRQWWQRMRRGGYGGLDVSTRLYNKVPVDELPFHKMVCSSRNWTLKWGGGTFLLTLLGSLISMPWGAVFGLAIGLTTWLLQAVRIGWGVRHRVDNFPAAIAYGFFTLIGKWAQLMGQYSYLCDLRAGRFGFIGEYKGNHDSVSS